MINERQKYHSVKERDGQRERERERERVRQSWCLKGSISPKKVQKLGFLVVIYFWLFQTCLESISHASTYYISTHKYAQ